MKIYTKEEALKKSTEYFDSDALAAEVFINKYAMKNDNLELKEATPDQMHRRMAKEFARVEKKYPNPMLEDEIFNLFDKFKYIVPQGSPMFGIGNIHQRVSISNCFAISVVDSYGGICRSDERIAQISKRRGGVGMDISALRPKGQPTNNSALTTDGIVVFMQRFSNTSREVAQCIAGGQKVLTMDGLKNIEDVIPSQDKVWTKKGWVGVLGLKTNKKTVHRIKTLAGYEISASLDHVFLVHDGDRIKETQLRNIEPGDNVVMITGTAKTFTKYVSLDADSKYKNSNNKPNNCKLPEVLKEDLAYMLGYSYGDGYVEKNKYEEPRCLELACGHKYPIIQSKLESIIDDTFGYYPSIRKGGGAVNRLSINNKCVVDFLDKNGLLKQKAESIVFPLKILQSPSSVQCAFISGYFDADGYASGKKKGYCFASINAGFLSSLKTVLMSLGILSKTHCESRIDLGWNNLYNISVTGSYSKDLFKDIMSYSEKVKLCDHCGKRDNWLVPYTAKDLGIDPNHYNYICGGTLLSIRAYDKLTKDKVIGNIGGITVIDEVIEIEERGETDTYDLVLEDEHLFWCEGFYVHNSGRRGALLLSISVHHPEVLNFIRAKLDLKKVTGANISVKITDEFMDAVKKDKQYEQRWPVDSSKPTISQKIRAREVWDEIIRCAHKNGEPGILFIDTIQKNSPADSYKDLGYQSVTTNPCTTGDTMVYVADGRSNVSFKELADDGSDVPVFCKDNNGNIVIKTMRHPRITGYHKPIYKVTLDDGSTIRCTGNHKIQLKNGEYKEAKDLIFGDSLSIITRFEASIKDVLRDKRGVSQNYYWVNNGFSKNTCEHRLIASHKIGRDIKSGEVVHHSDYNGLNNNPCNLEVMTKAKHDSSHKKDKMGDNNPMRRAKTEWSKEKWQEYHNNMSKAVSKEKNGRYLGVTNEELIETAINFTKQLGRRFSKKEWYNFARDNGFPIEFSGWRRKIFGSISGLAKLAAKKCGVKHIDEDPRTTRLLQNMIEQKYDAKIINHRVFVSKICEGCKKTFWVEHFNREVSFCGMACHLNNLNKNATITKEKQLRNFTFLKASLGRTPFISEWKRECKLRKSSSKLGTKYGFKTYSEVKNEAEQYNHRVISVELDGYEDVYNGTVDDFHNFFIGGFESQTKNNKRKWVYVNNLNCGELPLNGNGGSCILLLQNLASYVNNPFSNKPEFDEELFRKNTGIAQRLIDDMVDLELEAIAKIIEKIKADPEDEQVKANELNLWQDVHKTCSESRRTGLGITGLGDCIAMLNVKYGSKESLKIVEKVYSILRDEAYRSSIIMAKERGAFPIWDTKKEKDNAFLNRLPEDILKEMHKVGRRNIALLTTSPAGSVSLLARTTNGFGPVFLAEHNRKRKLTDEDKEKPDFVDDMGDKWKEYKVEHPGFKLYKKITGKEFKGSPYDGAQASEVDYDMAVKMQGLATSYTDHAISITINAPNNTDLKTVDKIYMNAYDQGCKGITFYRDGSRDGVLTKDSVKDRTRDCEDCDDAADVLRNLIRMGQRPTRIITSSAPKRPEIVPCEIHRSKVGDGDWLFFVGMLGEKPDEMQPYEIFGGNSSKFIIPQKYKNGWIVKNGKNKYGVTQYNLVLGSLKDDNEKMEFKDLAKHFNNKQYGTLTRSISGNLRHGMPLKHICEQLLKNGCAGDMWSFPRAIARILKKYIADGEKSVGECPMCHSTDLSYKNGCPSCKVCGHSNCS